MYENKEKKEKKELKKKLKQLKHENKILQKKLNSLQFRINAENRKTAAAESRKKQDAPQNINADRNGDEMIDDICESEMLFTSRSYPGYLIKLMKSSSLFSNYNKFIVYFRRAKLLGILFRIIVFILRASALILAYGVAFLVSIPVIIMMFAAMPVFSFINAPRSNSKITKKLSDKNVYILFPGRNSGFEKSKFFLENIRDLSTGGTSTVIVVSPYFIKGCREFGISAFYSNYAVLPEKYSESKSGNILFIRKYYYFSLLKHVINPKCKTISMIY